MDYDIIRMKIKNTILSQIMIRGSYYKYWKQFLSNFELYLIKIRSVNCFFFSRLNRMNFF